MSEENVEIVRRVYDAFHRGDIEAALAYFDPDVVADASQARPDLPTGHGREELRRIVMSWVGSWDEWREEIEEMRDVGSQVLVFIVQHGRGKGSGIEVEAAKRSSLRPSRRQDHPHGPFSRASGCAQSRRA